MTQTQQELERLRTLQESCHDLADDVKSLNAKMDTIISMLQNNVSQ